jgi:hypothetical protein
MCAPPPRAILLSRHEPDTEEKTMPPKNRNEQLSMIAMCVCMVAMTAIFFQQIAAYTSLLG